MDENEELLIQLIFGMSQESRHQRQRFIRLVAARD